MKFLPSIPVVRRGWMLLLFVLSLASAQEEMKAVASTVSKPEAVVYRLAPFDKISVSVYGEPDLSTSQLISDSGTAFIPLIGPVEVGGKTVNQASKLIEKAFVDQQYLKKPVVTISIEAFSPKVLTVMGEVNNPGTVTINPGMNGVPIQIAIAEVGGFKNTAKSTEVTVTRASVEGEEGSIVVVNVDTLLQSKSNGATEPPFLIRPGDVVYVPRRVF